MFCLHQVSNDNVLYKLKIRHHQNRGALLYGTKQPEHLEEEEEKENEKSELSPKMSFQSRISGIHKVSSIERAERRRERQARISTCVASVSAGCFFNCTSPSSIPNRNMAYCQPEHLFLIFSIKKRPFVG